MNHSIMSEARPLYREGLRLRAERDFVRSADFLARAASAALDELDRTETAEINFALGATFVDLKRYAAAAYLLQGVVEEFEIGFDTSKLGDALNSLGNALFGLEDFSAALTAYRRSEEVHRQGNQPNDKISVPVRNRALCLRRLGQSKAATELLRGLLESVLGTAEREAVSYQLAIAYDQEGAPGLAQAMLETLLPTASNLSRPQLLNSLAISYDNQGMSDAALRFYKDAATAASRLGDLRLGYVNILFSYASHSAYLGEIRLARNVVRRAMRWIGKHPDARDRRSMTEIRFHLATASKQPALALALLRRLEADDAATLGKESPVVLRTRILLADTLRRTDPAAALAVLANALADFGDMRADPQTGFAQCVAAEALLQIGRAREANVAALGALTAMADTGNADFGWYVLFVLAASLWALDQRQGAVLVGKLAAELMRRLQLLMGRAFRVTGSDDQRVGHVWRGLIESLARTHRTSEADAVRFCFRRDNLLDAARRDQADAALSVAVPMTTAEADALMELEAIVEARRAAVARAASGQTDAAEQEREAGRHRGAMSRWTRHLSSPGRPETPPLPDVAPRPEVDLALSYLVLPDRLIVSLFDADGVARTEVPIGSEELGLLCYRYRVAITDAEPLADDLGRQLFTRVLAPVWARVRSARHVRIAADGALRYIPFCALVTEAGYLVEAMSVSYWAGAPHRRPSLDPRRSWRVIGAGTSILAEVGPELDRLPSCGGRTILLDASFTGDALADALSAGAEIVHLASHFDLDPVHAGRSRLRLGDGSALTLDMLRQRNRFDFTGVELLFLSGCNTGTAAQNAEIIESLAGVFHLRGVRDVVATLWPVLDTDASAIAAEFYAAFADGAELGSADSLRRAQIARLRGAVPPCHQSGA